MKKLIIVALLSIITTTTYSQSFYKVIKASILTYNGKEWITSETNYPDDMLAIVDGKLIKITNKSDSRYYLYEFIETENRTNVVCNSWKAYDKDGDYCHVLLTTINESTDFYITILYSKTDIGIEYKLQR